MTTYNTRDELGSAAAKNLFDNAENLDFFANDRNAENADDRFGNKRLTWHGIEQQSKRAMSSYGYITKDSFEAGATLDTPNTVLRWRFNGEYYRWDGDWSGPKVVPAGSTPESTGGIRDGGWVSVGDAALRGQLSSERASVLPSVGTMQRLSGVRIPAGIRTLNYQGMRLDNWIEDGDFSLKPHSAISEPIKNAKNEYVVITDNGSYTFVNSDIYTLRIMGYANAFVSNTENSLEGLKKLDAYCLKMGIPIKGSGVFNISSSITLQSKIDAADLYIHPKLAVGKVIWDDAFVVEMKHNRSGNSGLRVINLYEVNNKTGKLVGIKIDVPEMVCNQIIASGFSVNWQITSYSCTLNQCSGINGGDGVSAYAPSFNREINTLFINGGDWFNNSRYAMDIGDDRFETTIPTDQYHGNGITITGKPRIDQGTIRIDKVIGVEVEAYFEKGASNKTTCIELGGAFDGSVRGFTLRNTYARDYEYVVKCKSAVSGLAVKDNQWRAISKCALYLTSDIYPYTYMNNTQAIPSFQMIKEVHTGVRRGLSVNPFLNKTIDNHGLFLGNQNMILLSGVYSGARVVNGRNTFNYNNSNFREYLSPKGGVFGSVVNGAIKINNITDSYFFNGGDRFLINEVSTYISSVDYDEGIIVVNEIPVGATTVTVSQAQAIPFLEGFNFEMPTDINYRDGSICRNTFTVTTSPNSWVLKRGIWVAG